MSLCSACGAELKNKVLSSKNNVDNTSEQTNMPIKHIILSMLIFIVLFATIAICSGMNLDEVNSAIWSNDYRPSLCHESLKFIIPGSIIVGLCACTSRIFIKNIGIYIQLYSGILNVAILPSPEFLNSQAFIKKFSLPPEREGM